MIYFYVNIPIIRDSEIEKLKNHIHNQFIKDFRLKSELKRNSLKVILDKIHFKYFLTGKEELTNTVNLIQERNKYNNNYFRYYFTILLERDLIFDRNFLKKFCDKNTLMKTLYKLKENLHFDYVDVVKHDRFRFYFESGINNFTEFSNKLLTFISDNLLENNLFEINVSMQDFSYNVLFSISVMQNLLMNFFKLDVSVKYHNNTDKSFSSKHIRNYCLIANESSLSLSFNRKLLKCQPLDFYFVKYIRDRFISLLRNLVVVSNSESYDRRNEKVEVLDFDCFYKLTGDFMYFKERIFIEDFKGIYKFLFEDARLIEMLL